MGGRETVKIFSTLKPDIKIFLVAAFVVFKILFVGPYVNSMIFVSYSTGLDKLVLLPVGANKKESR